MKYQKPIETIVTEALITLIEKPNLDIARTSVLADEFGIDSTELVFVVIEIEKQLGHSLENIDYGRIITVGELIEAVENNTSKPLQHTS